MLPEILQAHAPSRDQLYIHGVKPSPDKLYTKTDCSKFSNDNLADESQCVPIFSMSNKIDPLFKRFYNLFIECVLKKNQCTYSFLLLTYCTVRNV